MSQRPRFLPNFWDMIALLMVGALIFGLTHGWQQAVGALTLLDEKPLSLDISVLPDYALRTALRMFVAIFFSLLFTLTYATIAAKTRWGERLLIPVLDILQSVPILGFLSFVVIAFMNLFPGQILGAECAAIFAIFTSQAWNMAFNFYRSLKTVPADLIEVSRNFQQTSWQRFWRLEVPFAVPGLIWNTMLSMSGGWFFVVASEAISVGKVSIKLPGIGSYLALAIEQKNISAIVWAILMMFFVITLYDQLIFRPLIAWSDKFRVEQTQSSKVAKSWFLSLIRSTRILRLLFKPFRSMILKIVRLPLRLPEGSTILKNSQIIDYILYPIVSISSGYALFKIWDFSALTLHEYAHLFYLGATSFLRIFVVIALSTLVWIPLSVWLGLNTKFAGKAQAIIQFLVAFPSNLLFPIVVVLIVKYNLNPEIWLGVLIMMGSQWFIVLNVIAGASAIPNDLREVSKTFQIKGFTWWKKIVLPAIFPAYITGALTASGAAWNTTIVAEVASWGELKLEATGLGAYIAQATTDGNYPHIVASITVMSLFVLVMNRLVWRPLQTYSLNYSQSGT